ncbi:hypothetical protein N0V95_005184 [Ascochyta clinopodiicola]|nr:hypothetical protein N0V95_005184 [Ascochyta clinopodiicola]
MRSAAIVAALAVAFNVVAADVVCNSGTLHYRPRILSATERDGFVDTINKICGNVGDKSVQEPFESTVFSRIATKDTFIENECKANFQSIVEACVAGKNTGGGRLVTDGLTVEIHLDTPKNESRNLRIAQKKEAKDTKTTKPKPGTKKDPTKPKDRTPGKTPTGKTCSLKPGKGKGAGKGQTDKGKKAPTKVVRDLISKLFRRAGSEGKKSSDYGSDCDDKAMIAGGAWGADTYRGYKFDVGSTMSSTTLLNIAKDAYNDVKGKRTSDLFIVAALFVPGQGVFLGTVPHGVGVDNVKKFGPTKAPELWKVLGGRTSTTSTLYHAEDMAMLHAIESGGQDGNTKFPAGSKMATWGKLTGMPKDNKIAACGARPNIDPSCRSTLVKMKVAEA